LGPVIGNMRGLTEFHTHFEATVSRFLQLIARCDALEADAQAKEERTAAATQEHDRLRQAITRAREELRTVDVELRAARVRHEEELRDLQGRIPLVHAQYNTEVYNLEQVQKDIAATKFQRLHIA
jgi:chromosome segregation ATPase